MIVATTTDGCRFYSGDGQLFCDGDITIYSPQFLPEDTVLSSTFLGVWIAKKPGGTAEITVTDVDSGYTFLFKDGLTVQEAGELGMKAFDEFAAEKEA